MDRYRVILVVDRWFGDRIRELPRGIPAWVVDSPLNHSQIVEVWSHATSHDHHTGLTSFHDSTEDPPAALAAKMIATIELHHGSYSHNPPVSQLTIIGAAATSDLLAALGESGFQLVQEADSMLECEKKAAEPSATDNPGDAQ
ncbi:hypothetical protein ASA1KI_03670 [Opitutales bacterium ASA1]|uniref:hypothetical protein n=1 Tax=Congregicoccus parvus TaxID=3081749 RepID=UPI002B2D70F0|nr:hypothetical protein ASA1KI_03670 [Opitutales bacterium ASA1]